MNTSTFLHYFSALILFTLFLFTSCNDAPTSKYNLMGKRAKKDYQAKAKSKKQYDNPNLAVLHEVEMTKDPALGYVPRERLLDAYREIQDRNRNQKIKAAIAGIEWTERGPNNVGGRTRAILIDPNDPSGETVWAAGVTGGLWKTTSISQTNPNWVAVNDFFTCLAITCMAYDPNNTNTFYFGTGEGWYGLGELRGQGVWKTTDGGQNWQQLSSTANNEDFYKIQKIMVHPSTGDVYVATRSNGIQRSQDGGDSWEDVLSVDSQGAQSGVNSACDIEIAADGTLYVGMGIFETDGIYKSSTGNAGSWEKMNKGGSGFSPNGFWRIELACAPSNANIVYALVEDKATGDVKEVFRSNDAGGKWNKMDNPEDTEGSNFGRGQAWYDLIAAVHPEDANTVVIGGIDLYKSTNGGTSWQQISHWYGGYNLPYCHADQHMIVFDESDPNIVYFGNDGGLYRTLNIGASQPEFEDKNIGYNVTQFYAGAMHPEGNTPYFIGGTQDNGSYQFNINGLNETPEITGGDGGYCHIDQSNSLVQLTSYVYNNIYQSTDGGKTFTDVNFGIYNNVGKFINPSDYDNISQVFYGGYTSGSSGGFVYWTNPNSQGSPSYGARVYNIGGTSALTADPNIADKIYLGTDQGLVFVFNNASQNNFSYSNITGNNGDWPSGYISCVEVEKGNTNHILLTFSNYGVNSIWESFNAGASWTSVEGNLPDIPVRWALFNPNNNDQALIATDLGVFSTDNLNGTNTDWQQSVNGLANVSVHMLQYRESDNLVMAATHGRGVFTTDAFTPAPNAAFDANYSERVIYQGQEVQFYDGSYQANSWSWDFDNDGIEDANSQNPSHVFDESGYYTVSLSINNNVDTETKAAYIHVLPNLGTPFTAADGGDFESNLDQFGALTTLGTPNVNAWEIGAPSNELTQVNSGTNAAKTQLSSNVLASWTETELLTPNYNFTADGIYTLSFYKSMETEDINEPTYPGAAYVAYSLDRGQTWQKLGTEADPNGVNWYDRGPNQSFGIESDIVSDQIGWVGNYANEYTEYDVSFLKGNANVAFKFVYVLSPFYIANYAFDGFMIDDFQVDGPVNNPVIDPLPVELLTFDANMFGNEVMLIWQTVSETDNSHFEIERMIGDRFEKIGEVGGAGTSTALLNYEYVDRTLPTSQQFAYYQLKQVDFDGKSSYSSILKVDRVQGADNLTIFPTMATSKIQVRNSKGYDSYSIINEQGQLIDAGRFNYEIPVDRLAAGVYIIRFINNTGKQATARFVKI